MKGIREYIMVNLKDLLNENIKIIHERNRNRGKNNHR